MQKKYPTKKRHKKLKKHKNLPPTQTKRHKIKIQKQPTTYTLFPKPINQKKTPNKKKNKKQNKKSLILHP